MAKQTVIMYVCDMCGSYMDEPYGYFNIHMKEDHDLREKWLDLCENCYDMIRLKKISFRKADNYRIFHDGKGWKSCGYNEVEGAEIEWLR